MAHVLNIRIIGSVNVSDKTRVEMSTGFSGPRRGECASDCVRSTGDGVDSEG